MKYIIILLLLLMYVSCSFAQDLKWPDSVAVDKTGDVYVLGALNNSEQKTIKYTSTGNYVNQITNILYRITSVDKKKKQFFVRRTSIGTLMTKEDVALFSQELELKPDAMAIIEFAEQNIIYPSHISIGPNDNIYTVGADIYRRGNGRVAVIDPNDGHTILAFGEFTREDKPYGLWNPRGIAVDKQGNIYVANQGPYCVKKFGPKGEFLAKWGARGTEEGKFMNPMGIAVDPRNSDVYVLDSYEPPGKFDLNEQMRVQKFTKDGKFIKKWGERWWIRWPISWNNLKEQLMWALYIDRSVILPKIAIVPTIEEPSGIAVDSKGYVYIAERRKYRINKFTANGRLVKHWGRKGSGPGEFLFDVSGRPIGMAVDKDDNIYVVDHDNDRVQKFSSSGKFLAEVK